MCSPTRLRLLLVALVAAGALIVSVTPAGAQFTSRLFEVTGIGGGPVVVQAGDGGVEVVIPGRVDTAPVSPPGTAVFVTGVDGERVLVDPGPVTITGTVNTTVVNIPTVALQNGTTVGFSAYDQALLAGDRDCQDFPIGNNTIDGGGVFEFVAVAGQQTASFKIHNCGASVDYVSCFRSSYPDGGPLPTCAVGNGAAFANVPIHNGESWIVDGLNDTQRLRCIACTHAGPPSAGSCLAGGTLSTCTPSP